MGRPTKQGIDYFPYDVDLDKDDKLQMIIAEFGHKGEVIYTKLLAWIYKHNGYYTEWNEMEQLKFANRVAYAIGNSQVNLISSVVAKCVKWGLFDQHLCDLFQVLTSKRIQSTWWEASRKRKEREIDPEIWLLGVNDGLKAEETKEKAEVINKVNKSKVKEKETIGENALPPAALTADLSEEIPAEEAPVSNLEKEYKRLPLKDKKSVYEFIRRENPVFIQPYVDFWNLFAGEHSLPKVTTINKNRRKHFAVRIQEKAFNLPEILRRAKESEFLRTSNWFGFDWLIKNDTNYLKVLEGNFNNEKKPESDGRTATEKYLESRKALEQRTLGQEYQ